VIELWVIRKGLAPEGPESRRAAFAIARAIGQGRSSGTANTGAHMVERGFEAAQPAILKLLTAMVEDLLEMLARNAGGGGL